MMKLWIFNLIIIFGFNACMVVSINKHHRTPSRPFKYPKFTEADTIKGNLSKYRLCFDVNYYDLQVQFFPSSKYIVGNVLIEATAVDSFSTLQIDLYDNMQIDSIIELPYNRKLMYYRKYHGIFVVFPYTVDANKKISFKVYYRGKPNIARRPPWEGGFVWRKDKNKKVWAGVACQVMGSSVWWPSKDHLSDEPDSMTLRYTVPAPYYCVANGVLVDSLASNDSITYIWKVHYPINTYNVTFYIGDFTKFDLPYKSDSSQFIMSYYVLKHNYQKAKEHFNQVNNIIWQYEKLFGAYPWPNDGFKLVESPYEGMEHQSAIAYGSRYKNLSFLNADYIILHEVAHEWWGNSVTVPDYSEIWIHEGIATYSEALFAENTLGYDKYLNYLRVYSMFIKNKRPLVGPNNVNYWDYKDTDVYVKGSLMLHTLRNTIRNDSIFKDILKTFYQRYKYGWAISENFIKIVNEKVGKDYTYFFDQYLYSRNCPLLLWDYSYDMHSDKAYLYYKFDLVNDNFTIPIKIQLEDKSYLIYPTKKLQKLEIPTAHSIILNTEHSYISIKRTSKFK